MTRFSNVLFEGMRRMDAEACTSKSGKPAGLNWYGSFGADEDGRRNRGVLVAAAGELLPELGFPTRVEVRYPSLRRCKCDNVVTLEDGSTLWLKPEESTTA